MHSDMKGASAEMDFYINLFEKCCYVEAVTDGTRAEIPLPPPSKSL